MKRIKVQVGIWEGMYNPAFNSTEFGGIAKTTAVAIC